MINRSHGIGHSLDFLAEEPDLLLAIIFGSAADGSQRPDSDLDLAVYCRSHMGPFLRQKLSDDIAVKTGRTVDLIDLSKANGALLRQVLRSGQVLFVKSPGILGTLTERLLAWQEDFEPQLNGLLQSRLERFTSSVHGS
jgi:predicted nucleotidyltransferase